MCGYVNQRWPAANITIQTQVAEGVRLSFIYSTQATQKEKKTV